MKKMTKEELIDFFIIQLGDNKILGQVMTIEQIREKLNANIEKVTYEKDKINEASWDPENNVLNFDLSSIIYEKSAIIHELLHVLSTSKNNESKSYKVGLQYSTINDEWNRSINEGMTDWLTMKITGKHSDAYVKETELFEILSIVLEQGVMLKKYFEDISKVDTKAYNIFSDAIIDRYGESISPKIIDNIERILALLDEYQAQYINNEPYGINENSEKMQQDELNTIEDLAKEIFEHIMSNETDIDKKIEMLIKCLTFLNKSIYLENEIVDVVLNSIIHDKEFNNKKEEICQRIEMTEKALMEISKKEINKIKFTVLNAGEVTSEERLKLYKVACIQDHNFLDYNKLYDLYVDSQKITETNFDKREMFWMLMRQLVEIKSIDVAKAFEEIDYSEYQKIGDYYQMLHTDNFFDNEGYLLVKRFKNMQSYKECIQNYIQEKGIKNEKENVELIQLIGDKLIRVDLKNNDDEKKIYFFTIKDDGNIEEAKYGEPRRFLDDMSKLDIELSEETADVSLTEMMEETNNLKVALSSKEYKTKQSPIGGYSDGR